jgi:hypothetical protein
VIGYVFVFVGAVVWNRLHRVSHNCGRGSLRAEIS